MITEPGLSIGDYVFATKYGDGDPADGWAVGFYNGPLRKGVDNRHMVVDEEGKNFRGNGFRAIARIPSEVAGRDIIAYCMQFEFPNWPEDLNLWDVVIPLLLNMREPT